MSYVDTQTALNEYAQFTENPSDPGEDYHLLSTSAAIEGLHAVESLDMSRDAAKSSLPAIVASRVESLLQMNGLDIDLDRRKDLLARAAGQAVYLFDNP